jgi:hypothetical protein
MSLIACVDARTIGRFFADFPRICRALPAREGRQGEPSRRLLGIVLTRGPWVGELSEALEAQLHARWSVGLSGVWSLFAPGGAHSPGDLIRAVTELPSPHNLSMIVPVLPTRDAARRDPGAWPAPRYPGQVLAPLLQSPRGALSPAPAHVSPASHRSDRCAPQREAHHGRETHHRRTG